MAYTDLDFTSYGASTPSGGSDGLPLYHLSLPNPLTGRENFGREFNIVQSTNQYSSNFCTIKAASYGSNFDTVPDTKAISLRIAARLQARTANDDAGYRQGIGLAIKCIPAIPDASIQNIGYQLILEQVDQAAAPTLRIAAKNATSTSEACSGTYAFSQWYNLRLDVIPIGASGDQLNAYTGTGSAGNEVWTQVGNLFIPAANTAFVPWSNAASKHGFFISNETDIGLIRPATTIIGYVDYFVSTIDLL
jgi:hypothetical protein